MSDAPVSADQADAFLADHPGVRWVDLLLFDANGIARGKRVRAADLPAVAAKGVMLPRSVFATDMVGVCVDETGLLWETGDADCLCHLRAGTLAAVAGTDLAQAVLAMPGAAALDPLAVLDTQVSRLTERGLRAVAAVELEFYLTAPMTEAQPGPVPPAQAQGAIDRPQLYMLDNVQAVAPVVDTIYRMAEGLSLPVDALLAESGPAQFEINLKHKPDAIGAALDGLLLKRAVKLAAQAHGLDATFMAKPYGDAPGSGCHIHLSLIDAAGVNVFANQAGDDPPWSPLMLQALGGLMAGLPEGMALWAPTFNAYRRYVPKNYVAQTAQWGRNNRTVALRLPTASGAGVRVEHRIAGADANPVLVMAGLLAGVLHGLEHGSDPGPETFGYGEAQTGARLPVEWGVALDALDQSALYRAAFGDRFVFNYLALKRAERARFLRTVSEVDHRWYGRLV